MHRFLSTLILLVLSTQTIIVTNAEDSETTPVIIVDYDGILKRAVDNEVNPTLRATKEAFAEILDKIVAHSKTVIFFIEDTFSLQDISMKDKIGTAYPFLREKFFEDKTKVLLNVFKPYNYLKKRFTAYNFNTYYLRVSRSFESLYKSMYVYFDDSFMGNETRISKLRHHDHLIQETLTRVKNETNGTVIAVYTGRRNSLTRRGTSLRRDREDWKTRTKESLERTIEIHCGNSKFRLNNANIVNEFGKSKRVYYHEGNCNFYTTYTHYVYELLLHTKEGKTEKFNLRFIFLIYNETLAERGWKLIEITYGRTGEIASSVEMDVEGTWQEGYTSAGSLEIQPQAGCTETKTFSVDSYTIMLGREQPMIMSTSKESYQTAGVQREDTCFALDDDYLIQLRETEESESRLLTPGIAAGLLVSMIDIMILSWGIQMMMSIKTNSQYDAPNSKPLFNPDSVTD